MWVLLPVKRFASGKSRLSTVLSTDQRIELVRCMISDVLRALRHARCVERVIVLSNERGIDNVLKVAGVERFREAKEGNINQSLMSAIVDFPASVNHVLILPADVPAVGPVDIEMLAQSYSGGIALSPASVDGGTNAFLSFVPMAIRLQFAEGRSFARHHDAARCRGIPVNVVSRESLARDMDRPDDLEWLARSANTGKTAALVRELFPRETEYHVV